jgi:hypothetical protein
MTKRNSAKSTIEKGAHEHEREALADLAFRWIQRAVRLAGKIDEAFAGEPFSREWPAHHPKNVKRFNLYVKLLMKAFDLEVMASNFWVQLHDADTQKPVRGDASEVPPGYRVVAYAPGQTLWQREEVAPEQTSGAQERVTSGPGLRPNSRNGFVRSEQKSDHENTAQKKNPPAFSQRMSKPRRTRNV